MHLTRYPGILLLLALAFYNAGTSAQALSGPGPRDGQRLVDDEISSTEGFLNGHPDQRWRRMGLSAYDRKVFGFAREYFRRAARYADKASQAMYAQMLWDGQGGAVDRPLAYAWMDLAADLALVKRIPCCVIQFTQGERHDQDNTGALHARIQARSGAAG
jgi:TPR repeat protein